MREREREKEKEKEKEKEREREKETERRRIEWSDLEAESEWNEDDGNHAVESESESMRCVEGGKGDCVQSVDIVTRTLMTSTCVGECFPYSLSSYHLIPPLSFLSLPLSSLPLLSSLHFSLPPPSCQLSIHSDHLSRGGKPH
jgi:hypothetical protein